MFVSISKHFSERFSYHQVMTHANRSNPCRAPQLAPYGWSVGQLPENYVYRGFEYLVNFDFQRMTIAF